MSSPWKLKLLWVLSLHIWQLFRMQPNDRLVPSQQRRDHSDPRKFPALKAQSAPRTFKIPTTLAASTAFLSWILRKLRWLGQTPQRAQRTVLSAKPTSGTELRSRRPGCKPKCAKGTETCPSLVDYKNRHAPRRGGKLRFGTPAQGDLGSEVSGSPDSRREDRKEALLVRSISTPVPGGAPSLWLLLRVFAGGGSGMARLSKLRGEGKEGSRWGGGVSGSGRLLPSPHAPSPPLPEGAVGGGGKGRGKVV